jgi:hypothetical protein
MSNGFCISACHQARTIPKHFLTLYLIGESPFAKKLLLKIFNELIRIIKFVIPANPDPGLPEFQREKFSCCSQV